MNYEKEKQDIYKNALISVIIPVYNGERYIAEAIDSVLAQEYENIEIIAVNDGSTDGTEEVLRSYANVRYLYQPRQGASSARNKGIKCSSGDSEVKIASPGSFMTLKTRSAPASAAWMELYISPIWRKGLEMRRE